jgi:hypothetical protein
MDFCQLHVFDKHEIFPTDRKSNEYKKINIIRTKLLKINAIEATNYINQKIRINSQNIKDYLNNRFGDITINLKTKQIQSAKKTRVSFIPNLEDIDIQPFINKCSHHYHKFQKRKKVVLAKHGLYFMNQNSNNDSNEINNEINNENHNHHHHHHHNHQTEKNKDSKDLEKLLYLLTGKIDQKTYFDYLHSLFYSLHQKLFIINKKKKKIKFKNDYDNEYDNDFGISKRRSSPSIIKVKNNLLTNHLNISNKFKRSNSNISNTDIIHLIKCKEK